MTDEQKRIVERVAQEIYRPSAFHDPYGLAEAISYTRSVLQAANYWKLRKAAKQALEDITAYRRLNSIVPADVPDGPTEKALRAALKGGGESE